MLDFIDLEPATPKARNLDVRPPLPDVLVERCEVALTQCKVFTRGATCPAARMRL